MLVPILEHVKWYEYIKYFACVERLYVCPVANFIKFYQILHYTPVNLSGSMCDPWIPLNPVGHRKNPSRFRVSCQNVHRLIPTLDLISSLIVVTFFSSESIKAPLIPLSVRYTGMASDVATWHQSYQSLRSVYSICNPWSHCIIVPGCGRSAPNASRQLPAYQKNASYAPAEGLKGNVSKFGADWRNKHMGVS